MHPTRAYGAAHDDPRPSDPRLEPLRVRAAGLGIHHVDTAPSAAPDAETVVLLPGVVSTHRYYRDNIGALAGRYRVIAPDLPGFGRSDKPDAPYTPSWYTEQVLAFLDEKGVSRAHFVGNSLGGQVALLLALRAPERVGRLVLVSPAGFMPWGDALSRLMDTVALAAFPRVGLPRVPRIPRAALHVLFTAAFPTRSDLVGKWVRGYAEGVAGPEYPHYVRAAFRSMRGSLQEAMHETVRDVAHPTLIIWGARDRILPASAARPLLHAMPDAELLVYEDSGHCAMIDQPARWNDEVLRFLAGERVGARPDGR